MRICYLGTPNTHTNRWLQYFIGRGHQVHFVTSSSGVILGAENHRLRRFGPPVRISNYLINSASLLFQLRRLIGRVNPDVVHVHYIDDVALLAAVSGFHPFAVTAWGSDIMIAPRQSRMSTLVVKYVLSKADLVTCDSEHVREALIRLGVGSKKVELIGFGVDVREFMPAQKDASLISTLGVSGSPTIISVRLLEPLYDIETSVRAMSLVVKEIPQAKLVLLGGGSQEAKLKELSKSLGVSDSVRFVGRVPADEVPRYLTSADVCVSTALSDSGPGGITEAMACELPVIATDFGDNRKWVEDGVNGFIIPLRSPQVLASRIVYLLQNRDIRGRFGKANRQIIVERNNWKKEMGKMEKLYEESTLGYGK